MRNVSLEAYPEALKCKLSNKLLTDPVIDLETGKSYDRESFHAKFPGKKSAGNIVLKNIVLEWASILEELEKPTIRVPKDFTCPVSLLIYESPVVLPQSGHSYESNYIQTVLSQQRRDPVTREAVPGNPILVLNVNVQQIIAWCERASSDFAEKVAADWKALREAREQFFLEEAINIIEDSQQIITNPTIPQVHRRCTYLHDALRVPIYSRGMEWFCVFSSNGYSKVDLQERFKRGVINLSQSSDITILNTLVKILNIVKQSRNRIEMEEKLRNECEVNITSGFVAMFGMNREEILRLFTTRLGAPSMSDSHKNMKQQLERVDSEVWLDEIRAKLQFASLRLNFGGSVRVIGMQNRRMIQS
ncbi:MAG: hypothetical protein A3F10_03530 [Coxiella sp. RIFCSPHIGHO2_12_FULL_42_15]|nr:MAG: hypothetical protein A3F10_03530 [Coxiella sp. RIFCSPHIGHO2_12_FULL_42_15]